ncbi:MAG: response regulator [Candidatus Wallbacteria bacterium]|nr:response regulator [Candidatus Wallbacteria bacterium]
MAGEESLTAEEQPKKHLLLVEDEAMVLSLLEEVLQRAGFDVTAFADSKLALADLSAKTREYDCVVTDVWMPDVTGLDIVRRAREVWPDTPVVLVTGVPDLNSVIEGMRLGASDYVLKPAYEQQIRHVVNRAIERAQLNRSLRLRNQELSLLLEASGSLAICERQEDVRRCHFELRARLLALPARPDAVATLDNIASQVLVRIAASKDEEQAKLGALLDHHPAGLIYLDPDGVPVVVSRRAIELLGLAPPAPGEAWRLPEPVSQAVRDVAERGGRGDIRSPVDSGRLLKLELGPVQRDGRGLGTVVSLADVTQEREKDLQLFLTARLATIGEIVSGLSHELNNPLAIISGYAGELTEHEDAQVVDFAKRIKSAAGRCSDLFRRMLPLLSPVTDDNAQVDLHEQCRAVVEVLQGQMVEKRLQLQTELKGIAPVPGTVGEVREIVLAVVLNAIDALEIGQSLAIRSATADGFVRLTIADTGHGIPPEVQARIFDPFFTTKPVGRGTGLGLTLVHSICSRLGAQLSIQSEVGKGTTVEIAFPNLRVTE